MRNIGTARPFRQAGAAAGTAPRVAAMDPFADPRLRELMGQFICIRIVQAWGLDLSLFQYDMNTSWAAFFLNSDRTGLDHLK